MNGQFRMILVFVAGLIVGGGLMALWRVDPEQESREERPAATPTLSALTDPERSARDDVASVPVDPAASQSELAAFEQERARIAERRHSESSRGFSRC